MPQGYLRRKSRAQAQQEIQWGQRRFDGAQNSDTVASKIGDTEVALSINTAHTASDIQGHWGRKLLSPEGVPGTGRLHQVSQHPKTGRWLVHRGNKLWLSTGRDGTGWAEVTSIGPDGALTASGSFEYGSGSTTLSGDITAFLTNMNMTGLVFGRSYNVEIVYGGGTSLVINVLYGDDLIATGDTNFADTPVIVTLTEVAGSGVSGSVAVAETEFADLPVTGGMTPSIGMVIDGPAALFLSDLTVTGWDGTGALTIEIQETVDGCTLYLYVDAVLVSTVNSIDVSSQPVVDVAIPESGGSGISAVVTIGNWTNETAVADVVPSGGASVTFTLRGLTLDNTGEYELWWKVVVAAGMATVTLYKDAAMTMAVASGSPGSDFVQFVISEENGSGIVGYGSQIAASSIPDGIYSGTTLEFSFVEKSINENSAISSFRDYGFIVFIRGVAPSNVFVDQRTMQYWLLSTQNGYGDFPILGIGPGTYAYRYLYTYSRIVSESGIPDYTGNRISANLSFEGPSNLGPVEGVDYSAHYTAAPISESGPSAFELQAFVPTIGSPPTPAGLNAASYITHISIYRTLDVGVNGVGINGAANNSEVYIWVADVPIYSTEYTDTTSDATLRNRLVGASTEQDSLALRSRLFREMARGIGAIGPDFMVTAEPLGQQASYCDIAVNPRLIGFNFPGTQRFILQDPICEIYRTKDLFVFLCPSSTYTSISSIQQEVGIAGLIPIISIQNFEPASRTIGIKYGQGVFPVDESSFVTLCGDGTVRIFSGGSWSDPMEGTKLHGVTSQILPGAVFSFFRRVMLMWGRTADGDGPADTCLRYVVGPNNPNGSQWTEVSRPYWAYPGTWCGTMLVEDDESALRVAVFDYFDNAVFAVEDDLPLRQFEDDKVTVTASGVSGDAAEFVTAMYLAGAQYGENYDIVLIGITPEIMGVYIVDGVTTLAQYEGPIAGQPLTGATLTEIGGSGISGTFSISGFTGGYAYGVYTPGGAVVSGAEIIPSLVRLRQLEGAQANYRCSHEESHVKFTPRYGQASLPAGLEVIVRGYADGILAPGAVTTVPPDNSDIQFFAPVVGETIQVEYETNKSGWRITNFDTRYNSRDMQAPDGPWNGQEAEYQEALDDGLVSWLYGSSGLVDRASPVNARYPGAVPEEIEGPGGSEYGQAFTTAVERALAAELQDYTLMLWVLGPLIGPTAVAVSDALGVAFPAAGYIDAGGGLGAAVSPEVYTGNGWQHFAVVRDGLTRKIYQNGVEIGTLDDAALVDAAVMTVGSVDGTMPLCDIRLYDNALPADVLGYYYNDVTTNEGRKVLP